MFKVSNKDTRMKLALNKFQTLLWCFYYYFEEVNVGWDTEEDKILSRHLPAQS